MSHALAGKLDLPTIMQRIAAGEYASHVAHTLGISPQILSYHLRKHPDWQSTLETAHEVRLDTTEGKMDGAIEERDFDLARARADQLKRREWRASVECPSRWGQKQDHAAVAVQVVLQRYDSQGEVVEVVPKTEDLT